MKIIQFITLLFITFGAAKSQDTTKILFLGNSFTYYNNMPDIVKGLADSAGINTEITMYAPGGMYVYTTTSMTGHDSSATTESYIISENWDFIVVQDNQGGYVWSEGYINPMITNANVVLFNKIKNNNQCTRVIYFAGWAMEGGLPSEYWNSGGLNLTSDNTADCIKRIYRQFLYVNNTFFNEIVTPIGLAWITCLNEQPAINLFSGDGVHPSLSGSYLTASTIFTTIFKTDPTNLAFDYGLDAVTAQYLRTTGYNTVITDTVFTACNLDDFTPVTVFNPYEISTTETYSSYQWVLNNVSIPGATDDHLLIETAGNYNLIVTDTAGCKHRSFDMYCEPEFSDIQFPAEAEFELFPNPANDYVIVRVPPGESTIISLYNSNGMLCMRTKTVENYRLNLSGYSPGIYFVGINNTSMNLLKKFFVEKK
ncbi:MAG: hypothetical protein A2W91_03010 [Bacteroidetes bacterium GWF2_38_335]|nr:MAG: hypothetical protein A2W91_03010 [Bacteroidetes bacterium GWF2_38_335]OFY77540.1 MAG: hypothetical protein A2281_01750 [Bacteroidetes bacterium RIFOXYA12_FULL_38_20]HBS87163.1 hypothetical protein [Bacteroidales bacterium]